MPHLIEYWHQMDPTKFNAKDHIKRLPPPPSVGPQVWQGTEPINTAPERHVVRGRYHSRLLKPLKGVAKKSQTVLHLGCPGEQW